MKAFTTLRGTLVLCALFYSFSYCYGQSVTETLVAIAPSEIHVDTEEETPKYIVPTDYEGGFKLQLFFDNLSSGTSYELHFAGNPLIFDDPEVPLGATWDADDQVLFLPAVSETLTVFVPLQFCEYTFEDDVVPSPEFHYDFRVSGGDENILTDANIVRDPFQVVVTNYVTTITYDSSLPGFVPSEGDTRNLFYRDGVTFTRTMTFQHDGNILVDYTPDAPALVIADDYLELHYQPEVEIDPVSLTLRTVDGEDVAYSVEYSWSVIIDLADPIQEGNYIIPLDMEGDEILNDLAELKTLEVIEEFEIVELSSAANYNNASTRLSLKNGDCASLETTLTPNCLVEVPNDGIKFTFDILSGGDSYSNETENGIPLNGDAFDVMFNFRNQNTADADNPYVGNIDLGWIIVPIDLEALGVDPTDLNSWLETNTKLVFNYDNGVTYSEPISLPAGFARVYRSDIVDGYTCTSLPEVVEEDRFWRIAFDFSKLNDEDFGYDLGTIYPDAEDSDLQDFEEYIALVEWYETGVQNTFKEGTSFSILLEDLSFDLADFQPKNQEGIDISTTPISNNENFTHNGEVDLGSNFALFAIDQPLFDFSANIYTKVLYYSARIMSERMNDASVLSPHYWPYSDSGIDPCPDFIQGDEAPFYKDFILSSAKLTFKNPILTPTTFADPPGIIYPEGGGSSMNVDFTFDYAGFSGGLEDEITENPWDFESEDVEFLFDEACREYRARISIPLALAHKANIRVIDTSVDTSTPDSDNVIVELVNGNCTTDIAPVGCADPTSDFCSICAGQASISPNANPELYDANVFILSGGAPANLIVADGTTGDPSTVLSEISNGTTATCADDCRFYIDFKLSGDHSDWDAVNKSIRVHIQWNDDFLCPDLCATDCFSDPGTVTEDVNLSVYNLVHQEETETPCPTGLTNDHFLHMGQFTQGIFYICGPPCEADFHCISEGGANVPGGCDANPNTYSVHFNTFVGGDDGNSFLFRRNTFGYNTTDFVGDGGFEGDLNGDGDSNDSSVDELQYSHSLGFPSSLLSSDLPEELDTWLDLDESITFERYSDANQLIDAGNEVALSHFLPGDEIYIEAHGEYRSYGSPTNISVLDNPSLVFVVQTNIDLELLDLPCVPTDCSDREISLIFRDPDNPIHETNPITFQATRFFRSTCPFMEDVDEVPEDQELWTTLIFLFDDFYQAGNILNTSDNVWEMEFKGFVFMDPNPELEELGEGDSYIWQIVKGAFALMPNDYDANTVNNGSVCPNMYSCDKVTEVANFHSLAQEVDFELSEKHAVFSNCTRPFSFKLEYRNATYGDFEDLFTNEYRPIYRINNLKMTNNNATGDKLQFDHYLRGGVNSDYGLWYHDRDIPGHWFDGSTNYRYNFYRDPVFIQETATENHGVVLYPTAMGCPEIGSNGKAKRLIQGTALVLSEQYSPTLAPIHASNQQIGSNDEDDPQPQLMESNVINASITYDYLLDDAWNSYINSCLGVDPEDTDVVSCPIDGLEFVSDKRVASFDESHLMNSRAGFSITSEDNVGLTSSTGSIHSGEILYEDLAGADETYVNSIFLTLKVPSIITVDDVWLEITRDDCSGYWDCDLNIEPYFATPIIEDSPENSEDTFITFFFHQDDQECESNNPFMNCNWARKLFEESENYERRFRFDYTFTGCPDILEPDESMIEFYYGQACPEYVLSELGDPEIVNFNKCQTCVSPYANCPDCLCNMDDEFEAEGPELIVPLTSENSLAGSGSAELEYSAFFNGFVGKIDPEILDHALEVSYVVNQGCDHSITITFNNIGGAADVLIDDILLTLPDSWELSECADCPSSGDPLVVDEGAEATVDLTMTMIEDATEVDFTLPIVLDVIASTICGSGITVNIQAPETPQIDIPFLEPEVLVSSLCDDQIEICLDLTDEMDLVEVSSIHLSGMSGLSAVGEVVGLNFSGDGDNWTIDVGEAFDFEGGSSICFTVTSDEGAISTNIQASVDYSETGCTTVYQSEAEELPLVWTPLSEVSIDVSGACPSTVTFPDLPSGYEYWITLDADGAVSTLQPAGSTSSLEGTYAVEIYNDSGELCTSTSFTAGPIDCCDIQLITHNTVGCTAITEFELNSTCAQGTWHFDITDPTGSLSENDVAYDESIDDGFLTVSVPMDIVGTYLLEVSFSCDGDDEPTCTRPVQIMTTPSGCAASGYSDGCHYIWDSSSDVLLAVEGTALITQNSNYDVFGSGHQSTVDLDGLMVRQNWMNEFENLVAFGDAEGGAMARFERVNDAITDNQFTYTAGVGTYLVDGVWRDMATVTRINSTTLEVVESQVLRFDSDVISEATSIEIVQNGANQFLAVGGHADLGTGDGMDIFIAMFNITSPLPSVLSSGQCALYHRGANDRCYDLLTVSNGTSEFIVAAGESNNHACALEINFDLTLLDEFTMDKGASQFNAVAQSNSGELIFVGNTGDDESLRDGLILSTPVGFGGALMTHIYRTINVVEMPTTFDTFTDVFVDGAQLIVVGESSNIASTFGVMALIDEATLNPIWFKRMSDQSTLNQVGKYVDPLAGLNQIIAVGSAFDTPVNEQTMAVVHSDIEGNSCCLVDLIVAPGQGKDRADNLLFSSNGTTMSFTSLLSSGTPYNSGTLCDVGFKALEDQTSLNSLLILPNPNQGKFELQVEGNSPMRQVSIADATGKLVDLRQFNELDEITVESFNYQHLEAGIYILRVELVNGEILTARAVVNR